MCRKNSFTGCGDEYCRRPGDFGEEISRLAPACDMGLVIAPDHLMAKYTALLEQYTHNLGCGSMNAALCANKVRSAKILRSGTGSPSPVTHLLADMSVKPVSGPGAQGVRAGPINSGRAGSLHRSSLTANIIPSALSQPGCGRSLPGTIPVTLHRSCGKPGIY